MILYSDYFNNNFFLALKCSNSFVVNFVPIEHHHN